MNNKMKELIKTKMKEKGYNVPLLSRMTKVGKTTIYTMIRNSNYQDYPQFRSVAPVLLALDIELKELYE